MAIKNGGLKKATLNHPMTRGIRKFFFSLPILKMIKSIQSLGAFQKVKGYFLKGLPHNDF